MRAVAKQCGSQQTNSGGMTQLWLTSTDSELLCPSLRALISPRLKQEQFQLINLIPSSVDMLRGIPGAPELSSPTTKSPVPNNASSIEHEAACEVSISQSVPIPESKIAWIVGRGYELIHNFFIPQINSSNPS